MCALPALQDLARLDEDHVDLIKRLMHGSKNPEQEYPTAPWLFDVVSEQGPWSSKHPMLGQSNELWPASCLVCVERRSSSHALTSGMDVGADGHMGRTPSCMLSVWVRAAGGEQAHGG
jgi:hypothetical protein